MEKHLQDIIESNRQLKQENLNYRKEHMIPLGRTSRQKKSRYDLYVNSVIVITCREEVKKRKSKDAIQDDVVPSDIAGGMTEEKEDLTSGLFPTAIEIDSLMVNPQVSNPGNLIILPSIDSHNTTLHLDREINQSSSTSIML